MVIRAVRGIRSKQSAVVPKMTAAVRAAPPSRFGIRGIPALLFFKDGKVADQIIGAVPKETIERSITKLIS